VTDEVADEVEGDEREATVGWLELFLDLVVVAAIAVLASGLEEDPSLVGVGMFFLLFGAIWLTWITVVMYANVARLGTRTAPMVAAMFLIAVMAASAPTHFEERANFFAAGFLITRAIVSKSSMRTGRILTDWPLLQFSGLAVVWVAAMWVPAPWKYWMWAFGLVTDLLLTLMTGQMDPDRAVSEMNRRMERADRRNREGRRRAEARGARRRGRRTGDGLSLVAVDVNTSHLDDRLGTFIIIVLGEAVSQLVLAAATTNWHREGFEATVIVAFLTLVGLWWLTFSYGFTAAPHTRLAMLPPRFGLPLHLLTTAGIVCLASGLGVVSRAPGGVLPTGLRWVMCAGLAVYFLATGVAGLAGGASWKWLAFWAGPCVVVPIGLAAFGGALSNQATVVVLFAVVAWQLLYGRGAILRDSRRTT